MAQQLSYDVYLSFCEKGVIGQTFVSHLDRALKQEGVGTFKDDRNLERGICFANDSFKAIEESQYVVVVFCKNYVFSRNCLDELVKIMDCRKMLKKIVIPIFYDVEPAEVRNLRNSFVVAFDGRSEREVERWREALKEAGSISGLDLRKTNDGEVGKVEVANYDETPWKWQERSRMHRADCGGYCYKLKHRQLILLCGGCLSFTF